MNSSSNAIKYIRVRKAGYVTCWRNEKCIQNYERKTWRNKGMMSAYCLPPLKIRYYRTIILSALLYGCQIRSLLWNAIENCKMVRNKKPVLHRVHTVATIMNRSLQCSFPCGSWFKHSYFISFLHYYMSGYTRNLTQIYTEDCVSCPCT
jgi:hypothetical protein